jgi:hypothetical protein
MLAITLALGQLGLAITGAGLAGTLATGLAAGFGGGFAVFFGGGFTGTLTVTVLVIV